ncbi:ATP-binding cassette domain-containing protein [Kamptonema sp. UHCC 0994]|uniref:ABC transporter ATP-binding protein n=1 Tax=Kamptonema sp. UHCC 0994 TaxID=3031329 RepID=UPI0023B8B226|nr:ATP-binding cassette domain-containing protein [Kamptonema sp. UHCC 0994]MDF0554325.1 ATP-binding cassette domain-containing protein [Kamptonema sp. UHCC 0994]
MAKVIIENVYKSFQTLRKDEETRIKDENLLSNSDKSSSPNKVDSNIHTSSHTVLRRINLSVQDGEFMVLVGPSGCGKSTLLRSIAGLESLTGGNIWVGDRLVNDLPPKDRDIAMVFQNYALYPHLTVYDNLAFGLRRGKGEEGRRKKEEGRGKREEGIIGDRNLENTTNGNVVNSSSLQLHPLFEELLTAATRNLPKGLRYWSEQEKAVDERVRTVAQLLQIESLLHRLPKQLSGGQKQRVALGRAMARNPQVFLMDEPLSNLDAKLRAETRAQIVQLQRQLGTTTIYVTHDQIEAMTMGDRIAVMNQGQIQQVAKPLELYNQPANLFVAQFIGSPPMNFLPVQFTAPLLISHSQFRFTLPEIWARARAAGASPLQNYDGRSLILGIRPEHLSISPPATKNLLVEVEIIEALGHETYLWVCLAEAREIRLQVRIGSERAVSLGEKLWLAIAPDKIHLFDPETGLAIFCK